MEYCIVLIRGLDAQRRFVRKVCELIEQAWTPQGGVFCIMNGGCVLGYVQAMVRKQTALGQWIHVNNTFSTTEPTFLTTMPAPDEVDP